MSDETKESHGVDSPFGAAQAGRDDARAPRKNLMLAASIEGRDFKAPVRIRNLSESGAMIEGSLLPEVGTVLTLRRSEMEIGATVIWRRTSRCGIRFAGTALAEEWVSGVHIPGLREELERDRGHLRQSGASNNEVAGDQALEEQSNRDGLDIRIAEEIAYVRRMLDIVRGELSVDPIILQRHAAVLQHLETALQILGHLGTVVAADDRRAAADAVALEELRARLLRKSILS